MLNHLPTDAEERKALPVFSGVLRYFPDAIIAVAELSRIGNDQHNPGSPLFWDRSKSGDELDALARHLIDAGTADADGVRHSAKVAWRALANLQKEIEADRVAEPEPEQKKPFAVGQVWVTRGGQKATIMNPRRDGLCNPEYTVYGRTDDGAHRTWTPRGVWHLETHPGPLDLVGMVEDAPELQA